MEDGRSGVARRKAIYGERVGSAFPCAPGFWQVPGTGSVGAGSPFGACAAQPVVSDHWCSIPLYPALHKSLPLHLLTCRA
ncbi:MAG: hypothetical protein JWP76_5370 [Dactylosporangium sp.]|nr:hypothetical protein [Dactylosporangium sp.]